MRDYKKSEDDVQDQLRDIKVKLEEMDNNKRNNLIIYGLINDPYETHSTLHQKVFNKISIKHIKY